LKNEIGGKTIAIALELLVENSHGNTIELGDVGIEDYTLMAKEQDARFHGVNWRSPTPGHFEQGGFFRFGHVEITSCDLKLRRDRG
jgi:hypothetical protein